MRWLPPLLTALTIAAPSWAPAQEATAQEAPVQESPAQQAPVDERTVAYREFRAAFDGGDYQAALPLAARVVEITTSQHGPDAPELANPLSNLATTYYRMKQYDMALDAYRRALSILDALGNATDPRLVRPLHGLGATLHAMDRDADAVVPLKRAVDITRNRDGLHAISQMPMLAALIDSYMAAGRLEDAGREQQYATSTAEAAWGKNDIRLLPVLDAQARWNESMGQYTAARMLHTRAVQIADAIQPENPRAVGALRGIARCFRLAYINGEAPEQVSSAVAEMQSTLGAPVVQQALSSPSSDGERALRLALRRLLTQAGSHIEKAEVMTDLGDWYQTAGRSPRALDAWREAWREYAAAGDTKPLERPGAVVYRPPAMAVSRRLEDPDANDEQVVDLRLAIRANGDLRDASVANAAPERESAERAVLQAAKRALWRPAFANGEPVAADDFVFSERVFVKRPKSAD